MISDNPLLGPDWEPLGHVIVKLLEDFAKGDTFCLRTCLLYYGNNSVTSPQFDVAFDEPGKFVLELTGNLYLRPQISEQMVETLEFYGWTKPDIDPEDWNESEEPAGRPDFSRSYITKTEPSEIAEFIVTTLVGVFGMQLTDFIAFADKASATKVDAMKKLGRLKRYENNTEALIFAMPGQHLSSISVTRNTNGVQR